MRNVVAALVASSFLFSGSALGQTVTDVGEVVVDGDGNLSIGVDGLGSRTVDATDDGPYASVALGVNAGSSGELRLNGGSSFTTTGELLVGEAGAGMLELRGGSSLRSDSTRIFDGDLGSIEVSGPGTSWVNAGTIASGAERGPDYPVFTLADGAALYTNRFEAGRTILVVDGHGTRLESTGRLFGSNRIHVRSGAHASSGFAYFRAGSVAPPSDPELIVSGSGTLFEAASVGLVGTQALVEAGAVLRSGDVSLLEENGLPSATVTGAGSRWEIDGNLWFDSYISGPFTVDDRAVATVRSIGGSGLGNIGSLNVRRGAELSIRDPFATGVGRLWNSISVEDGGHLSTAGVILQQRHESSVVGAGSTWQVDGDLELSQSVPEPGFTLRLDLEVSGGGLLQSSGASLTDCIEECNLVVEGSGSRWLSDGRLDLFSSVPGTAVLRVADGGFVRAGAGAAVGEGVTLRLEGGVVNAPNLALTGGALAGSGDLEAAVLNGGTVDPGGSDVQTPGTLSIDGTYSQDAAGSLEILLTGSDVHTFDKVTVTGAVDLAGELVISVGDGFATELGDQFLILEYESRTGEFDQITGLQLGDGLSLRPVYTAEAMYLVTTPEPSTVLLLGAGLGLLGALRNRH